MDNFKFIAMDETKSETKVAGNIYLYDLFFIFVSGRRNTVQNLDFCILLLIR